MVSADTVIQASCAASCLHIGCGNFTEFCSCESSCVNDESVVCCSGFWQMCSLPGSPEDVDCGDLPSMITGIMIFLCVILFVIMLPAVLLSTYAWWNGMQLWQRLNEGDALVAGGAVSI